MSGAKHIIKSLVRRQPMVGLVRGVIAISGICGRIASALKGAALFPRHPDVVVHWSARVKYSQNITLGHNVIIGTGCVIGARDGVTLGDDVRLSDGVVIETAGLDFSGTPPFSHHGAAIVIGKGTWVGTRAIILGGVTIGDGCVIGAQALVVKDVPANGIVVGRAAELLRPRDNS